MDGLLDLVGPGGLVIALGVGLLAGAVKGIVGFAMPMILISGLSTFIAPELALAALILPTLVTNGIQALRQGGAAAVASIKRFRLFLGVGFVMLLLSAQLVAILSQRSLFAMIGVPIILFALMQLMGWRPKLTASPKAEASVGALAGFIGGLSGVWGPPTVAYLTAIDTPKQEQMRVQGVIYGLGAVALFIAHLKSGILNRETMTLSVLMLAPALGGMWLGLQVQDRVDQATFRKVTLAVLLIAGLNLLRRAIF